MERSYEIKPTENGWRLVVWEDGEEIARGAAGGTDDDYAYLVDQAESICGVS